MDYLMSSLEKRLRFVEMFHSNATEKLVEIMGKIDRNEAPYQDTRPPECVDEPAYLEEWEQAEAAIIAIRATCLDLLQSNLHAFLEKFAGRMGIANLPAALESTGKRKKDGWLCRHRALSLDRFEIDWQESGADLDLLEHVVLTRNDFSHNIDLHSLYYFQIDAHAEKYPDGAFVDAGWKDLVGTGRLIVPENSLTSALEAVRTLCAFLQKRGEAWLFSMRTRS